MWVAAYVHQLRRTQLCSKLKAQSSKLKGTVNYPPVKKSIIKTIKNIKGFSLLELVITVSVLGVITAIAVPSFTTMVQNNRIKATTNHIVSSLQFARQTAAIEQTQVMACTPLAGNPQNCALTTNWQNGIALVTGNAKIENYTPPPPPAEPQKTEAPAKPGHPGYPPAPPHPGYSGGPKKPSENPPAKTNPPPKRSVPYPKYPDLVTVPNVLPEPNLADYKRKGSRIIDKISNRVYNTCSARHDHEFDNKFHVITNYTCTVVGDDGSTVYSTSSVSSVCHSGYIHMYHDNELAADNNDVWMTRDQCLKEKYRYDNTGVRIAEYNQAYAEHKASLNAYNRAQDTNARRLQNYYNAVAKYPEEVEAADASYQKALLDHEAEHQQKINDWNQQKIQYSNWKAQIDNKHAEKMKIYEKDKSAIDKVYNETTLPAWEQQVDAHELAWQNKLDEHAKAMKEYNDARAHDPKNTVSVEQGKTLLAHNNFPVSVTSQLHNGVTAVIYNKDRIKTGHGQIYIEDKRGRGEHSRTICINMLGNVKVIKGNESCQ